MTTLDEARKALREAISAQRIEEKNLSGAQAAHAKAQETKWGFEAEAERMRASPPEPAGDSAFLEAVEAGDVALLEDPRTAKIEEADKNAELWEAVQGRAQRAVEEGEKALRFARFTTDKALSGVLQASGVVARVLADYDKARIRFFRMRKQLLFFLGKDASPPELADEYRKHAQHILQPDLAELDGLEAWQATWRAAIDELKRDADAALP
jgi:hypothetical protein